MAWNLHDVALTTGGTIVIRGEHWDGIGPRDFVVIETTSSVLARHIASELRAAADALDIKNEKRDEKRLRDLRVRRDALTTMQGITPEMVNAAWSKGKDLRMTGLPTDFRQVLEAAVRVHQSGWLPVDTAPEDQHVILMTTGGHVGEALMLRDEDTGQQKWTWALGPVHPNHTPLGWQPMPLPPPPAEGE